MYKSGLYRDWYRYAEQPLQTHRQRVLLNGDRGDLELGEVLAVALLAPVVLLRLHLVHDDLGPPQLLQHLSLNLRMNRIRTQCW